MCWGFEIEAAIQAHFGGGGIATRTQCRGRRGLAKPYARKMEPIGRVRDGDKGVITNGYWKFESFLVGQPRAPNPLVNFVYSLEQDGTHSQQQARRRGYEAIARAAGKDVVPVEDRGFDSLENFRDLQELKPPFLIRLTGSRELHVSPAPTTRHGVLLDHGNRQLHENQSVGRSGAPIAQDGPVFRQNGAAVVALSNLGGLADRHHEVRGS